MQTLIREKVEQAKRHLAGSGVDCWLTFARETQINGDPALDFLTTADLTWHSAFIISASGRAWAAVGTYDRQTVVDTGAYDEVVGYVEGIKDPLLRCLRELNPAQIAINYSQGSEICDGLTHGMYLALVEMLAEVGMESRLVSAEPILSALRERKTTAELRSIRAAVRHTEEIFAAVADFIRPGRTEKEIAAFMTRETHARGLVAAWQQSCCPAVFTGPDTADAHYAPTDRRVEPGHILSMDFGVKVDGYCSDIQRTFYILEAGGTRAPGPVQRGFETVVQAIESARKALRPGVAGHEVDAVARRILVEAGYEDYPHALGHQVGRYSHDGTALLGPAWQRYAQKPFRPVEPGMVFTLEPRLTVPEHGVATLEEMVVVTEDEAEFLTKPQRELILVAP